MNGLVNGLVNGENGAGRVVRCVAAGAWPVPVRWTADVVDAARVFGADVVAFACAFGAGFDDVVAFAFVVGFGLGLDDVVAFAFAFGAGLDDVVVDDSFFFGDALDVPC